MLLGGCTKPPASTDPSSTPMTTVSDEDMFTDQDQTTPAPSGIAVTLNGSSASCQSNKVSISGSTITIKDAGTYVLSGTLDSGSIHVDAEKTDEVTIILNGASITSPDSAALCVLQAEKVVLTTAENTENTLKNGGTFSQNGETNIDGAVFSKQDLTLNGSGALTVVSPAGHGIVCKDDLIVTGGSYIIQSASHGLDANDSFRFKDAVLTIDAGKDGIHVENTEDTALGFSYISGGELTIVAQGDGISSSAHTQISGGTISITAGGGSENGSSNSSGQYGDFMGRPGFTMQTSQDSDSTSMKGIKSGKDIMITGGSLTIDSADDAVHSNTSAEISGGGFLISCGDDAFHAEADLTISNGTIDITTSYEGLEALNIVVSGGKVDLTAQDDGLNAAGGNDASGGGGRDEGMFPGRPGGRAISDSSKGSVLISGGELHINASGDGIDANGTLAITGGYTVVIGPTRGDTATLDYDTSAIISGGTFIGTGAAGMAQTFSGSENQGVISVSVSTQQAGTAITLKDADGNIIISYTPELSFAVVILSSPDILSGRSYNLTVGSLSKDFQAS